MDARAQARLWASNKASFDRWVNDYCGRTSKTRDEVDAERRSHRFHDERAENVGEYDGYTLSACPLGVSDTYRYTVKTPWDEIEGLCDTDGRDDETATRFLLEIIPLMPEMLREPLVAHKSTATIPKAAKVARKTAPRPKTAKNAAAGGNFSTKSTKSSGRRGRPAGSRDSTPRRRRTKAEMTADETKTETNDFLVVGNVFSVTDRVAWIKRMDGRYHPYAVWEYVTWFGAIWERIEVDGDYVSVPANAFIVHGNDRPDFLDKLEKLPR